MSAWLGLVTVVLLGVFTPLETISEIKVYIGDSGDGHGNRWQQSFFLSVKVMEEDIAILAARFCGKEVAEGPWVQKAVLAIASVLAVLVAVPLTIFSTGICLAHIAFIVAFGPGCVAGALVFAARGATGAMFGLPPVSLSIL
jgi:hypothetical protein